MNIALFGGTFDPIHNGHVQAAKAAARKFRLDRVLFVPSGNPPHKRRQRLTPYAHRLAMVALACARERKLIPSLLEAPRPDGKLQYSVDTARAVRRSVGASDRLFFLIGLDAFYDLKQWKKPEQLLALAEFIVVSRPGFRIDHLLAALPPRLARDVRWDKRAGTVTFGRSRMHVLSGLHVPVASSEIRRRLRGGRSVTGLIHPLVEEYILKANFYKPTATQGFSE
ncbi:MAG: nicotinate-nucleotide adenylyltransferase [Terriglobia bacterium]